jgi:voltage-gated potassium channel
VKIKPGQRRWQKLYANWRDSIILLRQFRWPLLLFCLAMVGGGLSFYWLSIQAGEPVLNWFEAIYLVLGLTFLQPLGGFPKTWYLEIYYFIMPVIGIGLLAQGAAEFGVAFFNRRTRNKEWEMAVASTFNHHVILVGLGHLGFRVVSHLHQMDQDLVVIEQNPSADLIADVRKLDIPVLELDGVRESTLLSAGVEQARSIVLCTQNDSLNLQVALKARSLNPKIQVVVRIFDDDFAQAIQTQFGFIALSATGMAAPAFAAAGAGMDITRPLTIEGKLLSLARLIVENSSNLSGKLVGHLEKEYEISVVLLRRGQENDFHPRADRDIQVGDILAILGSPEEIIRVVQHNSI